MITLYDYPKLLKSKYVKSYGCKLVALPDAPSHTVEEVEQYNKQYYEVIVPEQRYEDIQPDDALFLFIADEDDSFCDLHKVGDTTVTDIKL